MSFASTIVPSPVEVDGVLSNANERVQLGPSEGVPTVMERIWTPSSLDCS